MAETALPRTLVLASSSPYRRELLSRLGLPFECVSPEIDEARLPGETPTALVRRLAEQKARAVAAHYPNAFVIGSDQVAALGDEVLGKPGSYDKARIQLERLSGQRVLFLTGLCLLDAMTGVVQIDVVPVETQYRVLDAALITRYLAREQPYHCAGSCKSEGLGIALMEQVTSGDPTALIGLPLIRLVRMLEQARVAVI